MSCIKLGVVIKECYIGWINVLGFLGFRVLGLFGNWWEVVGLFRFIFISFFEVGL